MQYIIQFIHSLFSRKIHPTPTRTLKVKTKSSPYYVYWTFDNNYFKKLISKIVKNPKYSAHILLMNKTLFHLYGGLIRTRFEDFHVLVIEDGEEIKNLDTIQELASQLLEKNIDRKACLWTLGGGVVGDIGGFLASIYMRGIDYIQVPTTLLAMVDSSIGGKTGINFNKSKNIIGAFYQPKEVIIHLPFLESLPMKELYVGLAEVIKIAIILDPNLFILLEKSKQLFIQKDHSLLYKLSYYGIYHKAYVVSKDERESKLRAILNFGHTLAHAIESVFEYRNITHGEAVSIGIAFATYYSYKKNYLEETDYLRVDKLLKQLNMPHSFADLPNTKSSIDHFIKSIITYMQKDKKNYTGSIYFIFITKIGKYKLAQPVDINELKETLLEFFKQK